jgi:hypothetical protein
MTRGALQQTLLDRWRAIVYCSAIQFKLYHIWLHVVVGKRSLSRESRVEAYTSGLHLWLREELRPGAETRRRRLHRLHLEQVPSSRGSENTEHDEIQGLA